MKSEADKPISKKKVIFVSGAVLVLVLAAVLIFKPPFLFERENSNPLAQEGAETNLTSLPRNENASVALLFAGDIMLSRSVGDKMAKLNNWQWPFEKIAKFLNSADLTFGNLEGPISDKGKNVGSIYSFRADPRAIEGLKFAGFDVLSVANNHIGDWSRPAMEDTFKILKENGIEYVGGGFDEEEAHRAVIKEMGDVKFGLLAYTNLGAKWTEAIASSSGVAWVNEKISNDIGRARQAADIVIVSFHFGEEYQLKSNSAQQALAAAAIDAGADLVIGHHPHVAQEIERYKGGWIAYSLGNFIFDQNFSEETMKGMILKTVIKNKKIDSVGPIKIKINKDYQASLAEEK